MATHILTRIEELFTQALQEKTGWGKNDVLVVYQNCVKNALIEESGKVVLTNKERAIIELEELIKVDPRRQYLSKLISILKS